MIEINLMKDCGDDVYAPDPRPWPTDWDYFLVYVLGNSVGLLFAAWYLKK